MSSVFGEARTVPASEPAKKIMKTLVARNLFAEQRDVWTLGASLGISQGQIYEEGKRETFQNINGIDPDRVFAAIMIGLNPDSSAEERFKKLVNHAEWGIRELWRKEENGTLDFSVMCQNTDQSTTNSESEESKNNTQKKQEQ
jgi:hypothetical protein